MTTTRPPTIGEQLSFRRRARRLSQSQLARQAGVSRGTVARIEADACQPTDTTVAKLRNALAAQ